MSLVGALVTLAIIGIGALALMNTQELFQKSTQDVDAKESVIQETINKAAILQSFDSLKLQETCNQYALNGSQPGSCNTNTLERYDHEFLYSWYNADATTRICIELTRCQKRSGGKLIEVFLTTHYEVKGKKIKVPVSFRKAK